MAEARENQGARWVLDPGAAHEEEGAISQEMNGNSHQDSRGRELNYLIIQNWIFQPSECTWKWVLHQSLCWPRRRTKL